MSRLIMKRSLLLSVAASVIGSTTVAYAQQQSAAIEEVVVTAQRRSEQLVNVPISMTVVSGDQLESAGVKRLEDIAAIAPGVRVDRTGLFLQPAVRGITSLVAGSNFENSVAMYVDGVYVPTGRAIDTDFVSVSQIQVLKGPQGTLFGRNATGGAIVISTLDPSLTDRSGRLSASYLRFNDRRFQGYFSTPITSNLAFNVSAGYRKSDDYIKDDAGFDTAPIENYNVTTKLLFVPTDRLKVTAQYEMMKNSDGRPLASTYEGRNLVAAGTPGTFVETGDNMTSVNRPSVVSSYQHTAIGKIEYDAGIGKLTSLTSYSLERDNGSFDNDGTKVRFSETVNPERDRTVQEDLNFASTTPGPLQYVVGFYYLDWLDTTASLNGITGATNQTSSYTTKSTAGYADATWQVVPKLFLTGGIRYSHETKDLFVYNAAGVVQNVLPSQQHAAFNSWTPRGVIRYELDDHSNVYGSYTRGYKSGTFSLATPFNFVQPEKVDAYEVGYKTEQGRYRLNLSSYYYNYRNLQISSVQFNGSFTTTVTTNATSAHIYGGEAQLTAKVADNFNVNAGLAYTHARYVNFTNAAANSISAAGLNTTSCPDAAHPCTQDWSGKRLARAPDWTFNLGADYTMPTDVGKFVLSGNLYYTSSEAPSKGDLFPGTGVYRYANNAYALMNLRVSWSPPNRDWLTFSAFGDNVTNTRYYIYRTGDALGDRHVLGQPATWGFQADARF